MALSNEQILALARETVEREARAVASGLKGGIVGSLRPELTRELELDGEVLCVSGGHDQACAALGSGVVKPGLAMVSTGTAEVVQVAMTRPALHEKLRDGGISVYRHVVPGLYLAMTLNHAGGLLLRWFRDTLGCADRDQARANGRDPYDVMLEDAPEGPTGIMVLPHFSGGGTPWQDTSSKGAFLGLTVSTDRPTLAKAILEGLTFELRVNIDLLREAGIAVEELRAVGGGARSPLWLKLKADVCRTPLRIPEVTEAACLGAALLAGVAAGLYADHEGAVAQAVRAHRRLEPDAGNGEAYDGRYQIYRRVYPTLIPLLREL